MSAAPAMRAPASSARASLWAPSSSSSHLLRSPTLPPRPRPVQRASHPLRPARRVHTRVARPQREASGEGSDDPARAGGGREDGLGHPSGGAAAPWPGAARPAAAVLPALMGEADAKADAAPTVTTATPAGLLGWAAATAAAVRAAADTATAPVRGWVSNLSARRLAALRASASASPGDAAAFTAYIDALLKAGRPDEVVSAVEAPAWPPASRAGVRTAAVAAAAGAPPARAPLNEAGLGVYLRALDRLGGLEGAPAGPGVTGPRGAPRPRLPVILADAAARADPGSAAALAGDGTPARPGASPARPLHIALSDGRGGVISLGGGSVGPRAPARSGIGALLSTAWLAAVLASFLYLGFSASRRYGGDADRPAGLPGSGSPALPGAPVGGSTGAAGMAPGSPLDKLFGGTPTAVNADEGSKPNVRFSDVRGCEESKAELEEVVSFLKDPAKFTRLGAKLPKGVLMTGPPGTGKTLLARAVAGEAGVPFFYRSGSQFDEVFVGLGSGRIRKLFEAAKAQAPCIVFIDEIDALGGTRRALENHSRQTLDELLTQIDGFSGDSGVIVIGATNLGDALDPALTRAGRFDRHVSVSLPDVAGRADILKYYLDKTRSAAHDVDVASLARRTPGFSGADLATLVNEAALRSARLGAASISQAALDEARDKVVLGAARPSMRLSDREREVTAYHEGGHALAALLTPGSTPIHKATIVPRGVQGGVALGLVAYSPDEDSMYSMSRSQMLASMDVALAGRTAEGLIFGPDAVTSGAADDLRKATAIARAMVADWGFSDAVGLRAVGDNNPYSGRGGGGGGPAMPSAALAETVDREVGALLKASASRVEALLSAHAPALRRIAKALLEHETLTGEELRALADGKPLQRSVVGGGGGGGSGGRGAGGAPVAAEDAVKSPAPAGLPATVPAVEVAPAAPPRRRWSLWRSGGGGGSGGGRPTQQQQPVVGGPGAS